VHILFTRSSSPLSWLIRRITGEPVSHVALYCNGWIIHSTGRGVTVELPQTFERHSEVVYSVEVSLDWNRVLSALSRYGHARYDFGGLLYLGMRYLIPFLPRKNLWQTSGMFLCTEWVTEVLDGKPDSMISPYGLYLRLERAQKES
jgi:hypothetical protein